MSQFEIRELLDSSGRSPFGRWFESLNAEAAATVAIAVTRLEFGNFSNVKSVGCGVSEIRIDFGPGYRVYFGQDGPAVVILVGGSAKARQRVAIAHAQLRRAECKDRKRKEG